MSKIINLRGTSGAGKTHIVKKIMERYQKKESVRILGRRQPLGYNFEGLACTCADWGMMTCTDTCASRRTVAPLFVVGHYEGACGGCDNIPQGLDYIYDLIKDAARAGKNVLYEGLIVASDVTRCVDLKRDHELLVIGLNTPLEVCLQGVQARRDARGDTRELNPKHTQLKFKALIPQRIRFKDAGVDFRLLDRETALRHCLEFLGIEDPKQAQLIEGNHEHTARGN